MFKRVRNKKGFTLIELMIVVAIVGILAAIAIPAYLDYTVKAKITEVSAAMDALATAASEYHAAAGYFPNSASAPYTNVAAFAAVSKDYVSSWTYGVDDNDNKSHFNATFNLTPVNGNILQLNVLFLTDQGYQKIWSASGSTLAAKYMPRK